MAQDYNLWVNDITHRFSPTSLTDSLDGSIYTATAVISSVTTNSAPKMSQWDAYFDLRSKLLEMSEIESLSVLPKGTTTELSALSGIIDGLSVLNITEGRIEICNDSAFQSAAGVGMASASAFGEMEEILEAGFTIGSTWIAASEDVVDANGNVTFVSDDTNGDYLLIGADGAGTYRLEFLSVLISSTGNPVTVQVHQNGTALPKLKSTENTSTTDYAHLEDWEDMALAAGDKLTLVHTISSGTITATSVKLEVERID